MLAMLSSGIILFYTTAHSLSALVFKSMLTSRMYLPSHAEILYNLFNYTFLRYLLCLYFFEVKKVMKLPEGFSNHVFFAGIGWISCR